MSDAFDQRNKDMADRTFGPTPAGSCVRCKQPKDPAMFPTDADRKEWAISRLCPPCWDAMFDEDEGA